MSKKQRQITSLLLAGMLAASTIGSVMAEEDTEAVVAEVNAEKTVTAAESDEHYQEAIGFLSYLDIFTGYEDGDMRPEETISRAELAAIILRVINIPSMATYKNEFTDVDSSHWAADVIQTAYDNSIINGMGDGTFAPDADVTYEQAVKMVMCAINYEPYAVAEGGYPLGYISLASKTDVDNHAKGVVGEVVTRRTVAKLVYNALTAEYPIVSGMNNGIYTYETREGITVLSEKRDIYYAEGAITATPTKSIDFSVSLMDNQICFEEEIMKSEMTNADEFVAEYSRLFYYDTEGGNGDKTALYAVKLPKKTESITINADDIEKLVTGYEGGTATLEYLDTNAKVKKVKLVNEPVIVYNDQPFTLANYTSINPTDSNGDSVSFDEFITPDAGTIKAVDFGKDGYFDILFADNYEVSVVKLSTVLRLQFKYPISIGKLIKLDTSEDQELKVKVTRDGVECGLNDLVEGDVVCVKMNANFADETYKGEKFITIEAVSDYIEGTVSGIEDETGDGGDCIVTIDGEEYMCVANDDVIAAVRSSMGSNTKFPVDKFGRIADVSGSTAGGLMSGEEYGWLLNVYAGDSGEDILAKMYTQDAQMETIPLASKVDYWAPNATENETVTANEIDKLIGASAEDNEYFLNCKASDASERAVIRLCKYRTNAKGEITRLYLAVDENTVSENSTAVRVDIEDHKEDKVSSELFAGRYLIENPVAQFTVPLSFEDLNESDTYKYRYAAATEFNIKGDNDLGYNCFFADEDKYEPGIAIRFIASANGGVSVGEYSTADDNKTFVLESIATGIDDDDEEIYILKGYRNGEKVEYTATSKTTVVHVNPAVRLDKETYDTTTIWSEDSEESLTSVLHEGDVIGVEGSSADALILMRFVDAKGLSEHLRNGGEPGSVQEGQLRKDEMFSASRDRIIFGYITDTDTEPLVQLDISVDESTSGDDEGDVTSDGSTAISVGIKGLDTEVNVINIGGKSGAQVDSEPVDVYEIERGDYIFIRRFKDDALREIYVFKTEE